MDPQPQSIKHFDRHELHVGLTKDGSGKNVQEKNYPMRLWGYSCEWRATIVILVTSNLLQLQVWVQIWQFWMRLVTSPIAVNLTDMIGASETNEGIV